VFSSSHDAHHSKEMLLFYGFGMGSILWTVSSPRFRLVYPWSIGIPCCKQQWGIYVKQLQFLLFWLIWLTNLRDILVYLSPSEKYSTLNKKTIYHYNSQSFSVSFLLSVDWDCDWMTCVVWLLLTIGSYHMVLPVFIIQSNHADYIRCPHTYITLWLDKK